MPAEAGCETRPVICCWIVDISIYGVQKNHRCMHGKQLGWQPALKERQFVCVCEFSHIRTGAEQKQLRILRGQDVVLCRERPPVRQAYGRRLRKATGIRCHEITILFDPPATNERDPQCRAPWITSMTTINGICTGLHRMMWGVLLCQSSSRSCTTR